MWRISTQEEHDVARKMLDARNARRRAWVEKLNQSSRGEPVSSPGLGSMSTPQALENGGVSANANASSDLSGDSQQQQQQEDAGAGAAPVDAEMNGGAIANEKPESSHSQTTDIAAIDTPNGSVPATSS